MNKWASGQIGRIVFHHMTTPFPKDSIIEIEPVTIFFLRTQHVPLNSYLQIIGITVSVQFVY